METNHVCLIFAGLCIFATASHAEIDPEVQKNLDKVQKIIGEMKVPAPPRLLPNAPSPLPPLQEPAVNAALIDSQTESQRQHSAKLAALCSEIIRARVPISERWNFTPSHVAAKNYFLTRVQSALLKWEIDGTDHPLNNAANCLRKEVSDIVKFSQIVVSTKMSAEQFQEQMDWYEEALRVLSSRANDILQYTGAP